MRLVKSQSTVNSRLSAQSYLYNFVKLLYLHKTDTLFPGNNMTIAELEPLTIRSGGSSSNHYATLPSVDFIGSSSATVMLFPGKRVSVFFCGLHCS